MNFPKTLNYIAGTDMTNADRLDLLVRNLLQNDSDYERASQALRRRFVRGAQTVEAIDRGGKKTRIKREKSGTKYKYFIEGANGSWNEPEERIWIVAMYALWQKNRG